MMMVALSPDAKGHLDHYLEQIRMALSGQESIDADEIERDVLSHIDAELSGESEPVPAHRLLAVLDRLGEPNEWVPAEPSAWRRPFTALSSRPGDWRLAFVSFWCPRTCPRLLVGTPCLLGAQLTSSVRGLFRPFANRYDRRHARRLALTGVVFAAIGIATLTLPRFLVARLRAQEITLPDAKPVDPVDAIVDAFRTHSLVALADPHGNEQVHAFRLALIRDPRLAGVVNDVVIEFGTARYQDVIDRFIGGEDVPYSALRHVWEDTTQIEFDWDLPVYEEFLRAIRLWIGRTSTRQPTTCRACRR